MSRFRPKILIFEEIKAFSIYKGLTMKKWSQIWWCHTRSRKRSEFWKFIFSCSRINFRNCHTNSKDKNYFFTVLIQLKLRWAHCAPPKPNKAKIASVSMMQSLYKKGRICYSQKLYLKVTKRMELLITVICQFFNKVVWLGLSTCVRELL